MDSGLHALDQLLWWMGEPVSYDYADDNAGGVESECLLTAIFPSGAKATIELSRNRNLRNTAQFCGERGEIEISLLNNTLWLRLPGAPVQLIGGGFPPTQRTAAPQSQIDIIQAEHDDFFSAVRTRRTPEVSGSEARRAISWIEACYRNRELLRFPWTTSAPQTVEGELR